MYQAPDKKIWKGNIYPEEGDLGQRWHQIIHPLILTRDVHLSGQLQNIAFLGFCCDEGIRRNKESIGAQKGPDAIRAALSDLPVHFNQGITCLFDAGNVICPNQNLETTQELLGQKTNHLLQHGFIPILLGGGHEISYGHYLGIHQHLKKYPEAAFGIINVDAHFCLNSYSRGSNNSTAFRQIADLRKNHDQEFHYLSLGIQQICNSQAAYKYARQYNAQYFHSSEIQKESLKEVKQKIDKWLKSKDWIYLSLDLRAISAAFTPGVSSPTAFGLDPFVLKELLVHLIKSGKVLSMDIAELCPPNDQGNRTALLAANLIFEVVQTITSLKT